MTIGRSAILPYAKLPASRGGIESPSGSPYWTPLKDAVTKAKFLEGWKITSTGSLTGLISGNTLVVGGSKGNYTFQTPQTASYKNADTDYIWIDYDGVTWRTTTEAELVNYDFSKTFVKYLDSSPYSIEEIWILKAGETLTTDEENSMRNYCRLSYWWSNSLSLYGRIKGNKPLPERYFFNPALGGTVSTVGGYRIHKFLANANFIINKPGLQIDYMIVAGGGGGGDLCTVSTSGGGGGAGGYKYVSGAIRGVDTYPVVVGQSVAKQTNGNNSVFDGVTSTGGGKGGDKGVVGSAGGSGGGGGWISAIKAGGAASPAGEGYAGGASNTGLSGGGGGAGAIGYDGYPVGNGGGGVGVISPIDGNYYAGGGGGGYEGAGGNGGGGNGAGAIVGTAGSNGTGGGGGGSFNGFAAAGGGSGIVLIRYLYS